MYTLFNRSVSKLFSLEYLKPTGPNDSTFYNIIADRIGAWVLSFDGETLNEAANKIGRIAFLYNSLVAPSPKQSIHTVSNFSRYIDFSLTLNLLV